MCLIIKRMTNLLGAAKTLPGFGAVAGASKAVGTVGKGIGAVGRTIGGVAKGIGGAILPAAIVLSILPTIAPVINEKTDGAFGRGLGKGIGGLIGGIQEIVGKKGEFRKGIQTGGEVGEGIIGFKDGGRVKSTRKALIHKGEFVLPRGVKPTMKQKKKVMKKKKKKKKKK